MDPKHRFLQDFGFVRDSSQPDRRVTKSGTWFRHPKHGTKVVMHDNGNWEHLGVNSKDEPERGDSYDQLKSYMRNSGSYVKQF